MKVQMMAPACLGLLLANGRPLGCDRMGHGIGFGMGRDAMGLGLYVAGFEVGWMLFSCDGVVQWEERYRTMGGTNVFLLSLGHSRERLGISLKKWTVKSTSLATRAKQNPCQRTS